MNIVQNNKKKVFVGMSGGVDSSVSAALLKKEGYHVTGVFIKVWQPEGIPCTWKEDRLDALRVAAHLDIPFITLDLEKEYKKDVIDYMIHEYSVGRTPNPDVMCNRYVKFGGFLSWALQQGADFVATGHYAQNKFVDGQYSLVAGTDQGKDQSYFLWTLTQKDLAHILFPVGGMEKRKVREIAKSFDLPNAEKRDSQGLCFVGDLDIKEFLKTQIKIVPGNVLNEMGQVIGIHDGALLYTRGERRGFRIKGTTNHTKPHYVTSKDLTTNTIVVSEREPQSEKGELELMLENVNWVRNKPHIGDRVLACIRYHGEKREAEMVQITERGAVIRFPSGDHTAQSGQSVVIYLGDELIGGGIIV